MSLFGSCENHIDPCPGCVDNQNLVPFIPPWAGETTFGFKFGAGVKRKTAYNGLNNTKNFRTSASSFVILKKSLTTVQLNPDNTPENMGKNDPLSGTNGDKKGGPSNTGGPGDAVESVPIITSNRSGWKGRLVTLPQQIGIDVKHNSYERYLTRKRGWAMRCLNC